MSINMRRILRVLHVILACIISFLIFYYGTSEFLDFHFQGLYAIRAPLYLLIFLVKLSYFIAVAIYYWIHLIVFQHLYCDYSG